MPAAARRGGAARTASVAAAGLLAAAAAVAQSSPAGLWKTIDDDTGREKSLVRIAEQGGVYTGRIEKVLDPNPRETVCSKCTDERRDQPITGLTIIRNARAASDDTGVYEGGEILDPANGKTYRLRLRPVDAGKSLEVRGYLGPFFRTQHWIRVE